MDMICGMQKAIDYIENHLTEQIDYDVLARQSFFSSYHFQRTFGMLCGFTVGEYIRNRRMSLAGAEIAVSKAKIIDIALKYCYESPDSFAKAFRKFHGITPSEARKGGILKSFPRLVINISFEGGKDMNYRIEKKPEITLTGFRTHFTGTPYGDERERQEEALFMTTRGKQWFINGASDNKNKDTYCVIENVSDNGYDFILCGMIGEYERKNLYNHEFTGVDFIEDLGLEFITIPETTYAVFETSRQKSPVCDYFDLLNLRIQIMTEWLPEMGFELAEAPELAEYHWIPFNERHIEVWLPIKKSE